MQSTPAARAPGGRLIPYTQVMYLLHGVAVIVGMLTAASIAGRFLFSVPSLIAVAMNYLRRRDARGSWLESHFNWQLRTFWWAFFWSAMAFLMFGWLALLWVGRPLLAGSYFLVGIWVAWRLARGWLALRDHRAIGA